jgi:hypothetical protein
MRTALGALTAIGLCLVLQGCAELNLDAAWNSVQEDFHYTYLLKAGGRLEVENQNGPIDISGWDQETVDISGTKYANSTGGLQDLRVDTSAAGNVVTVRTVRANPHWGSGGVRYSIRVPRRTELGRIVTSNGPIHIDAVEGMARVRTSNGPVRVNGAKGDLDVETSNGPVEATDVAGAATVRTSNGRIELSFDQLRDVRASTSNGAITLRLPSGAGAAIRAHTSNGAIQSDFDVTAHGTISRHSLEGTLGSGGPLLDLATSNGAIRVLRR